jgi:hypothetical protein
VDIFSDYKNFEFHAAGLFYFNKLLSLFMIGLEGVCIAILGVRRSLHCNIGIGHGIDAYDEYTFMGVRLGHFDGI